MWVAHANYDGAHVAFIWDKNEACPGHFLQLFESIPTVMFATNMSRYVLDKHAKIVYENSNAVFTWTLQMNHVPKARYGFPTWHDIEYRMYARYIPNRDITSKVELFVKQFNICNCSAMHIRATDLAVQLAKKKKPLHIESYYHFVETRLPSEPVYLLTDSPVMQRQFLEKYGSKKIIVFEVIPMPPPITTNETVPEDRRFTSLEHTLIDVLIAAHARHFKGAAMSSLTELVRIFSDIGRKDRGWCSS